MAVRGRVAGQRQDPESMLDAAMQETFAELAQRGSGVEVEDVAPAPVRRGQDQSRASERERDPETGQFVSTRRERRSSQDDVDPYDVLSDQGDEAERRPASRRRASAPPTDDEDDELYEQAGESDRRADARRRRDADEDEEEDDDSLDLEGGYDQEDADDEVDDEDEPRARTRAREEDDEDERPRKQGTRQKRFSKRVEREIARQVQRQVGRVIEQNQQLAQEQERRKKIDDKLGSFMTQVLGTPQRRQQLEEIVLNRRLPQNQRDAAADELAVYRRNNQYFENYRAAADAVNKADAAADMAAAVKAIGELRPLDPKVISEGNVAKTLLHAYVVGRALGQQEADREIRRLKKLLGNARGSQDERGPRQAGTRGSGALASSGGRRANGRVGRPDPLRGAFEKVRGVKNGSNFAAPTDDVLDALKRGELTFEKMGLGRLRI